MKSKRKYVDLGDGVFVKLPDMTIDEMDEATHGIRDQFLDELKSKDEQDELEIEDLDYQENIDSLDLELIIDELTKSLEEMKSFIRSLERIILLSKEEDLVDKLSSQPILHVLPKSGAVIYWGTNIFLIGSPEAAERTEVWIHEFIEISVRLCVAKSQEKYTPALCHLMACLSYMGLDCEDIIEIR